MHHRSVYLGGMGNVTSLDHLAQEFDRLFSRRVFRLETRDSYDAANERKPYAAFLAGEAVSDQWRDGWRRIAGDITASGREMARVHIVTEPAGDYMRFMLLHGYPANVGSGEHVGIIGRDRSATLPDLDFWLFDDDLAGVLAYDAAGAVERVLWHRRDEEPAYLTDLCRWRDSALRLATPLEDYVTANHIGERTAV
jgi:hypothetical protein